MAVREDKLLQKVQKDLEDNLKNADSDGTDSEISVNEDLGSVQELLNLARDKKVKLSVEHLARLVGKVLDINQPQSTLNPDATEFIRDESMQGNLCPEGLADAQDIDHQEFTNFRPTRIGGLKQVNPIELQSMLQILNQVETFSGEKSRKLRDFKKEFLAIAPFLNNGQERSQVEQSSLQAMLIKMRLRGEALNFIESLPNAKFLSDTDIWDKLRDRFSTPKDRTYYQNKLRNLSQGRLRVEELAEKCLKLATGLVNNSTAVEGIDKQKHIYLTAENAIFSAFRKDIFDKLVENNCPHDFLTVIAEAKRFENILRTQQLRKENFETNRHRINEIQYNRRPNRYNNNNDNSRKQNYRYRDYPVRDYQHSQRGRRQNSEGRVTRNGYRGGMRGSMARGRGRRYNNNNNRPYNNDNRNNNSNNNTRYNNNNNYNRNRGNYNGRWNRRERREENERDNNGERNRREEENNRETTQENNRTETQSDNTRSNNNNDNNNTNHRQNNNRNKRNRQ